MKNRIAGLLILSTIFVLGYFYLEWQNQQKEGKTTENNSGVLQPVQKEVELRKVGNSVKTTLIDEKDMYATLQVGKEKFRFAFINDSLALSVGGKNIGYYPVVKKEELAVRNVYGTVDTFLIEVGRQKFVYSKNKGFLGDFEMGLPLVYIKKSGNSYLIVSEKGVFEYDQKFENYRYNPAFADFVQIENCYLGIIGPGDKKFQEKYGITENSLVILESDSVSKDQKIIYSTGKNLNKIYTQKGNVFLENSEGEIFILDNY